MAPDRIVTTICFYLISTRREAILQIRHPGKIKRLVGHVSTYPATTKESLFLGIQLCNSKRHLFIYQLSHGVYHIEGDRLQTVTQYFLRDVHIDHTLLGAQRYGAFALLILTALISHLCGDGKTVIVVSSSIGV